MPAPGPPPSQLMRTLDTLKDQAKDALYALSSCLCQKTASIKINGRTFKIIKVLGEGGFSFVYLAQDEHSGRQFALKKIRCPTGSEGVQEAMREVEAYRRFRHPNIIRILDSAVVQDPDGDGKIVYLFLPLYKRGNLQDAINTHMLNGTHFPEREMLLLFRGTCEAVQAMHTYRPSKSKSSSNPSQPNSNHSTSTSNNQNTQPGGRTQPQRKSDPAPAGYGAPPSHGDDSDSEDEGLPAPEDDGEGGYSYDGTSGSNVPLMKRGGSSRVAAQEEDERGGASSRVVQEEGGAEGVGAPLMTSGEVVFDGDEEGDGEGERGDVVPYAHRDIKPGNVMVADDGTPILMDFGSTLAARITINTRSEALAHQDLAATHSTLPYRPPELLDPPSPPYTLTEATDIWSLGCLLFSMAYNHSPFEGDQGGNVAMGIMNGRYFHPRDGMNRYSEGLRGLIDGMIEVDVGKRWGIGEVLGRVDEVLARLQ